MTATARSAKSTSHKSKTLKPDPRRAVRSSRSQSAPKPPPKAFAEKVSVTVNSEQLAWMREFARDRFDGNVSAAFSEAVRLLRQQQAREQLLVMFGDSVKVTPEEEAAIVAEWG